MSETVGRVDFMAALDAGNAVRESRLLGEKIGKEGDKAGASFGDNFDSELSPRMRETTSRLGKMLNESVELDDKVLRKNSLAIRTFGRDGETAIDRIANRMFAFGVTSEDAVRKAFGDDGRIRKFWDELDAGSAHLDGLNFKWRDLSHNTKQWTLIIGAVLAGMQDLAVLSSAAGAGLFALGGGLSAAVAGGGAMVAVFSVLAKDVNDLPPELQAVASQFKSLGKELLNTRDIIASAAIQEMPNTFARLKGTVDGLDPSFARLGGSVGKVFDSFSRGIAEGTEGFEELDTLINNAASDFPALASAAGNWSGALVRGINKANPLVDQLIGYVDKLGDRFDAFTRSNSFDQWVATSSQTWKEFGEVLDATGRALNDLVTPASVVRTQEFLNNLEEFMPNLSRLLDVLGRVDVFGLAAQALNDFGSALSPLAEPAGEIADSLNDIASIVIEKLAVALGVAADVVAPLATGLANVLDAMPPGALDLLATGVIGLATAFVILKGAQGVAGAMSAISLFATGAGVAEAAAGKLAGGLKGIAGKAGLFGLVAVGALVGADAILEWGKAVNGVDATSRNAVAGAKSLSEAFTDLSTSQAYLMDIPKITNWGAALDSLNDGWGRFFGVAGTAGAEAQRLAEVLGELDTPIAQLANTDLPAATDQFSAWAAEVGASDQQVLNMLNSMPQFKQALEDAALSAGELATDQDLVSIALGETKIGIDANTEALSLLGSSSALTGSQIDLLSQQISNFGAQNLTARDAARTYEESLDALTESIATNGTTLDIGTAAGRANEAALDAIAIATLDLSAKTLAQTGSQQEANVKIAEGRQRLIEMIGQLGITGAQAEAYADKLGLVPADIGTYVHVDGGPQAESVAVRVGDAVRNIPTSWVTRLTVEQGNINYGQFTPALPRTAVGGTFHGAQARIIGEAGPEAVVPLRRPLGQVDPSVRWLSAIAQGMAPPMASGGIGGAGTTVIFEPGAIVVEEAGDPRATALEVADEVAERIGS